MTGINAQLLTIIRERLGELVDGLRLPPPVFTSMQGEFIAFDSDEKTLITRFPVLDHFLNPYGAMQGGIIAAAIDNTLGPLSLLVAPPNVTRSMEIKYRRPATPDMDYIQVQAGFVGLERRRLRLRADVRDPNGVLLAQAKAEHWVLSP